MHEEIIIAGTGGQGIMVMGQLLAHAALIEGKHVVWFPTYGPEARGGTADCTVIISSEEIGSPISSHPDTLIVMHQFLFGKFQAAVKPDGRLVINSSLVDASSVRSDCKMLSIAANAAAEEIGNPRGANMVVLGAYAVSSGVVSLDRLIESLSEVLPSHRRKLIPLNEQALRAGASLVNRPT
jgi:2-oxoglutarate ferredoxin oxidoreductase subunit gamma